MLSKGKSRMERMLERAVLFAHRKAISLGADPIEADETALRVLFDAKPHLEESEARADLGEILSRAPTGREGEARQGDAERPRRRA
jgi:hypothetical protein